MLKARLLVTQSRSTGRVPGEALPEDTEQQTAMNDKRSVSTFSVMLHRRLMPTLSAFISRPLRLDGRGGRW